MTEGQKHTPPSLPLRVRQSPASSSRTRPRSRSSTSAPPASPCCRTASTSPRTTSSGPATTGHHRRLRLRRQGQDLGEARRDQGPVVVHAVRPPRRPVPDGHLAGPRLLRHPPLDRRRQDVDRADGRRQRSAARGRHVPLRPGAGAGPQRPAVARHGGRQRAEGLGPQVQGVHDVRPGRRRPAEGEPGRAATAWRTTPTGSAASSAAGSKATPSPRPAGEVVDVLRVQQPGYPEKAAVVRVSADGKTATFDPAKDFIDFPGGGKKFTIRYDPVSKKYWRWRTTSRRSSRGRTPHRGGTRWP